MARVSLSASPDHSRSQNYTQYITQEYLKELEAEMLTAAQDLEFERAAQIRDKIAQLQRDMTGGDVPADRAGSTSSGGKGQGNKRGSPRGRSNKPQPPGESGPTIKGRVPFPGKGG